MARLVLASQSPRRKELLEALGVCFDVVASHCDETLEPGRTIAEALEGVALRKAREVAAQVAPRTWVLGADTGVVLDSEVLGKPRDRAHAEAMLGALSGRVHHVVTAVALVCGEHLDTLSVETEVTFQTLRRVQIEWYASLEEPYDKAGAYAIQGSGAFLVASIRGSYSNVVGLPMTQVARLLDRAGLTPWTADD